MLPNLHRREDAAVSIKQLNRAIGPLIEGEEILPALILPVYFLRHCYGDHVMSGQGALVPTSLAVRRRVAAYWRLGRIVAFGSKTEHASCHLAVVFQHHACCPGEKSEHCWRFGLLVYWACRPRASFPYRGGVTPAPHRTLRHHDPVHDVHDTNCAAFRPNSGGVDHASGICVRPFRTERCHYLDNKSHHNSCRQTRYRQSPAHIRNRNSRRTRHKVATVSIVIVYVAGEAQSEIIDTSR